MNWIELNIYFFQLNWIGIDYFTFHAELELNWIDKNELAPTLHGKLSNFSVDKI